MTSNFASQQDLASNYNFFTSAAGKLAFGLLETRWAVQFFSNLFLFADPCDDTWLDRALHEACVEARPPVAVFNSGFCSSRSYQPELSSLVQPTLILQGLKDNRRNQRTGYKDLVPNCQLMDLPGKNVLPWESPTETCRATRSFLNTAATSTKNGTK
jgi:hypothetical protein